MTDIVERATTANPIQAAEDVLARGGDYTHRDFREEAVRALSALLTHARTLEAELARLREPLGDGAVLVEVLVDIADGLPATEAQTIRVIADHIERQAAALAHKTAVADAYWAMIEAFKAENAELRAAQDIKLDAEYRNGLNQAARIISQYEMENKATDGIKHVAAISARLTEQIIDARKERKRALAAPAGGASDG